MKVGFALALVAVGGDWRRSASTTTTCGIVACFGASPRRHRRRLDSRGNPAKPLLSYKAKTVTITAPTAVIQRIQLYSDRPKIMLQGKLMMRDGFLIVVLPPYLYCTPSRVTVNNRDDVICRVTKTHTSKVVQYCSSAVHGVPCTLMRQW